MTNYEGIFQHKLAKPLKYTMIGRIGRHNIVKPAHFPNNRPWHHRHAPGAGRHLLEIDETGIAVRDRGARATQLHTKQQYTQLFHDGQTIFHLIASGLKQYMYLRGANGDTGQ